MGLTRASLVRPVAITMAFLVPCAYTYLDDLQNLVLRRRAASHTVTRPTASAAGGLAIATNGINRVSLPSLTSVVEGGATAIARHDPS